MIDLRVTQLESFLLCPFHYKYPSHSEKDTTNLDTWTLWHEVVTEYLMDKTEEKYEELRYKIEENKYPTIFYDRLYLAQSLPAQTRANIAVEKNITVNGQEFYLHWTIDLWENNAISDIKTSKGKRWDFILYNKIQWVVYSWLLGTNEKFYYYIFTKQKKPQLQIVEKKIDNIANEIKVMNWLSDYADHYADDSRECAKHLFCK